MQNLSGVQAMSGIRPILVALASAVALSVAMSQPALSAEGGAATVKSPAASSAPSLPKLTASQIVDKYVAARGGAQAWKALQTMQLSGKIEAGRGDGIARAQKVINAGKKSGGRESSAELVAANVDLDALKQIQLPFTLDLQRPNRMRLELGFDGKTAVQVFDGKQGWKYRPFLNRSEAEPFTAEEAKVEAARGDLDGPLIDYAAKGTSIELDGTDLVEGQPAYRLKVTPQVGDAKHVWIDGKTFLDIKVEGAPRHMDGKMHPVYIYQRDFRAVQGVMIPFVLETAVDGYPETHKILIDKGLMNPKFDASRFAKPGA
jgi:hypothetical protein